MKYIVCYSGGHSSAIVAVECVRKFGKENVILINHDISSEVEHPDVKRFKHDVADYLDIDITPVNMDGYEELSPLKLCKKHCAFQYRPGHAICTRMLKTEPFHAWLKEHYQADIEHINSDCKIVYGFDMSEPHRIQRRAGIMGTMGYLTEFPMIWDERTIHEIEEIGIQRPRTYNIFKHANCIGCLKAGRQHWYIVYCLYPHIFEEAKEAEAEIGYSIIKGVYLEELESKFKEMRMAGICPSDKGNPATFWADVKRRLQAPQDEDILPCECSL